MRRFVVLRFPEQGGRGRWLVPRAQLGYHLRPFGLLSYHCQHGRGVGDHALVEHFGWDTFGFSQCAEPGD